MADKAHKQTDKILAAMEQRLSAIYSRAARETGISWKEYLKDSTAEIDELQKIYDEAKKSGDQTEIRKSGMNLSRAKREQTIQNKRFKELSQQTAEEISHINETALAYINGQLPEVYALNYNDLDGRIRGYSFTLTDANTVKSLAESDKNLLPYKYINGKKDIRWNVQKINSEVLQGILQGESMDKIANRFSNVMAMDETSAIRNARTTVTSAECKGRQDSYEQAEKDGIIIKREWIATNDSRTRHWHADLDGVLVGINEPWHNEFGDIMYPGDPSADPANVYNCRCTIAAKVVGFKKK